MADTTDTIRERIMVAIEDHFRAQRKGVPGPDPYSITWTVVDRADISDLSQGKAYTLAIFDGAETITPGVTSLDGMTSKTIALTLEFRAMLEAKQRPSTEGNRIIGEIIRRMLEDETFGDLAIWIQETGNEKIIENQNDRQIEGSVFFNMLYRHSRRDPRAEIC
jgi:hypothetical protein